MHMPIPLSLYIHIPWCVKKCPYCDFNSHAQKNELPEKDYVDQLVRDLDSQLTFVQGRPIHTIFIGGGTPSLFSPNAYNNLFSELKKRVDISSDTEISLEANPGTTESSKFEGYYHAGINRLSIGVQSFQDNQLKILGRIHESNHAKKAFFDAKKAGFKRINIDLMFGLPNQTIQDALFDLQTAIDLAPSHLSWYQLTLEPNTYFHRFPPILPSDDLRFEMQQHGQALLRNNGFTQYEISAYSKNDPCKHNLNYWQFGDYLGIGAGAHAKLTNLDTMQIERRLSPKNPKEYLSTSFDSIQTNPVPKTELPLEFMMNALRLHQSIDLRLFEARTGLSINIMKNNLEKAIEKNFLVIDNYRCETTSHGRLFLNELLEIFL